MNTIQFFCYVVPTLLCGQYGMAINFAGFLRRVLKNGGFDGGLEFGFLKCLVARLHHSLVSRLHHCLVSRLHHFLMHFLGLKSRTLLFALVSRLHHCLVSRLHHFLTRFFGFERRRLLSTLVSRLHHCLVSRLHHFAISVAVGGVFGTQIRLGRNKLRAGK